MAEAAAAALGWIEPSPNLTGTIRRAARYAHAQQHVTVTIEHMLLALTEDVDAVIVLSMSGVNLARLRLDLADYIARTADPRGEGGHGEPGASSELRKIFDYASAAAGQAQRSRLDGSTMLAALVGEGRSAAAEFLKAQGMTYDAVLDALVRLGGKRATEDLAPTAGTASANGSGSPAVGSAAKEPPRSGGSQGVAQPAQLPEPQPEAPPTGRARPNRDLELARLGDAGEPRKTETSATPSVVQRAPQQPDVQRGVGQTQPPARRPEPGRDARLRGQQARAAPEGRPDIKPRETVENGPGSRAVRAPERTQSPASQASAVAPARSAQSTRPAGPTQTSAGNRPAEQSVRRTSEGAGRGEVAQHPGNPARARPPGQSSADTLSRGMTHSGTRAEPQRSDAPPLRGGRTMPASAGGGEARSPHPTHAPMHNRNPAPPPVSDRAATGAVNGSVDARGPHSNGSDVQAGTRLRRPPVACAPTRQPRSPGSPQPAPSPAPTAAPAAATAEPPARAPHVVDALEPGALVHNVPGKMRVGIAHKIEVRIAREVMDSMLTELEGGGAVQVHDVSITRAMSVRLWAPEGDFQIDPASSETQWVKDPLGERLVEDYASWRWTVTPKHSGWSKLILVLGSRSVSNDGLVSDSNLPDQVIEVRVQVNFVETARRFGIWLLVALAGGVIGAFGQQIAGWFAD